MADRRLPVYYLNHGGGPWPYMDGPFRDMFGELERALVQTRRELNEVPKAALVVSGHWEERSFAVSSNAHPGMIYDYSGFPAHLYRIRYGAPGSTELAVRIGAFVSSAGLPVTLDPERGFDHGTYGIMKPLYPEAQLPVVQISIHSGFDPQLHLALGRALSPLRDEGVLILGSGQSFHNPRFYGPNGFEPSHRFDAWLRETLIDVPAQDRTARLLHWTDAPAARIAHPREEHLLPLMVAVGAAEDEPGALSYHQTDLAGGLASSSFRFGLPPTRVEGDLR